MSRFAPVVYALTLVALYFGFATTAKASCAPILNASERKARDQGKDLERAWQRVQYDKEDAYLSKLQSLTHRLINGKLPEFDALPESYLDFLSVLADTKLDGFAGWLNQRRLKKGSVFTSNEIKMIKQVQSLLAEAPGALEEFQKTGMRLTETIRSSGAGQTAYMKNYVLGKKIPEYKSWQHGQTISVVDTSMSRGAFADVLAQKGYQPLPGHSTMTSPNSLNAPLITDKYIDHMVVVVFSEGSDYSYVEGKFLGSVNHRGRHLILNLNEKRDGHTVIVKAFDNLGYPNTIYFKEPRSRGRFNFSETGLLPAE